MKQEKTITPDPECNLCNGSGFLKELNYETSEISGYDLCDCLYPPISIAERELYKKAYIVLEEKCHH